MNKINLLLDPYVTGHPAGVVGVVGADLERAERVMRESRKIKASDTMHQISRSGASRATGLLADVLRRI
jgi:hypothetical protein